MAADVGGGDGGKKKGKKGRKKKSNPRIDMTPMVDLGFLLLTFFVLTTTMSTPTTMPVVVPADEEKVEKDERDKVSKEKILNILLTGKDRAYWYRYKDDIQLNLTNYSDKGIRQALLNNRKDIQNSGLFDLTKDPDPMIVLIKLSDDASYKNMVDILDEMNITEQKKYMLLDITREEVELVKGYEENQSLPLSIEKTLANPDLKSAAETGGAKPVKGK